MEPGWAGGPPLAISPIWVVREWSAGLAASRAGPGWRRGRSSASRGDDWARWGALVWSGLAGATPLVILATRAGLDRVDPTWADAARVVGAGRWRVWLDVTWPTLRPELGRVGGMIFTLALVEPAGPTILGLRRTLAIELTDAALRFPEPNRAAALAAIACLVAVLGRGLFAAGAVQPSIGWSTVGLARSSRALGCGSVPWRSWGCLPGRRSLSDPWLLPVATGRGSLGEPATGATGG